MIIKIKNYENFILNIVDYIKETHKIKPRNLFSIKEKYDKPLKLNDDILEEYECPFKELHVHNDKSIFCSEPERVAIKFILHSIFGKKKEILIKTLRVWLPSVTFESVSIKFTKSHIYSNLYPTYLYYLNTLETKYKLSYTYIDDFKTIETFHIQLPNKFKKFILDDHKIEILTPELIKKFPITFKQKLYLKNNLIMVRKRRSTSNSVAAKTRRRSRSRSRSRSKSPRRAGTRRRSRSSSPTVRKTTRRVRRRSRSKTNN